MLSVKLKVVFSSVIVLIVLLAFSTTVTHAGIPPSRVRRLQTNVELPLSKTQPHKDSPVQGRFLPSITDMITMLFESLFNGGGMSMNGGSLFSKNAQISFVPLGTVLFPSKTSSTTARSL